jgi:hypothetical protein
MKIAVIIIGIFAYNERILNEIIRCYSLDYNMVDIFIYNNNTDENNIKIVDFLKKKNINVVKLKSMKDNNKMFNINDKIIDNWDKFKHKCYDDNIINNNLSRHVPFDKESFFTPKISSPHQYMQIYLAVQEIIKYENDKQFKYDYIMKIRLDFYLKHDKFGPYHYFNDKNDILCKSYDNLKYYYDKIDEEDDYHNKEFRINNYLYWRTTKYLGGQFLLNKNSYNQISDSLNDRNKFNEIIKDKFVITINDACFFSSGKNFKTVVNKIYNNYGEYYDDNCKFWWTAEPQFLLSILDSNLYYFDYLQNNNYYKGREGWVNDYHGIEKYNHNKMNTE